MLIYSSRMVTGRLNKLMGYYDYNNASVFLEEQDLRHAEDPISHLSGQLDMTQKFFALMDTDSQPTPESERVEEKRKMIGKPSFKVYEGKVKVIASERQNKMIVVAID